jgi:hypothetical protein
VGYLIESSGSSRVQYVPQHFVSARVDGVLRLEWDISRVIDSTISVSAVDRADNVSEARVFTLTYTP